MERGEDGGVVFDVEEAEIARAALFTIEHYMTNVWDHDEISAVSGFTVERFAELRRSLDEIREPRRR